MPIGVTVELICEAISDLGSLCFINHEGKNIQLKGRVVHSVQKKAGKLRIGVSLLGTSQSIGRFVTSLVRAHHFPSKRSSARSVAMAAPSTDTLH